MKQDCWSTTFENLVDIIFCQLGFALHDDFVTLNRYNFTRILIYEVLIPALQHARCQLTTDSSLHVLLVDLQLFSKVKNLQDIFILLIAHCTKKGCYRQLLLTVDIGIHDIIDVCSKFNPWPLERDDTCTIKNSSIGMDALPEEHTWWTVQLWNNNTLGTIDDKCTIGGHIRNCSQENILNECTEILMIRIGAIQFHLSL